MSRRPQHLVLGITLFVLIILTAMATAISPTNPPLPDTDFTELKVETLAAGQGDRAVKAGDQVKVHYTGTLKDGTEFDSSVGGDPVTFSIGVGQVIQGWDQGLIGMKQGEKRRLEIPSNLGYGTTGAGDAIPANAGLVFTVELVGFAN